VDDVSGLSSSDCAESYRDSSAVAKDVEDTIELTIELARDSGRICWDGGCLKDDGGSGAMGVAGADIVSVMWGGAAASSWESGSATKGACTDNGEGSASTIELGTSFKVDAERSPESALTSSSMLLLGVSGRL